MSHADVLTDAVLKALKEMRAAEEKPGIPEELWGMSLSERSGFFLSMGKIPSQLRDEAVRKGFLAANYSYPSKGRIEAAK